MSVIVKEAVQLFRRELPTKGRLMLVETDERTQYKYTIWFDYTRRLFNNLKEGDILAVQNFSTDRTATHFSLIEITSVMPYHFALGTDGRDLLKSYPGFQFEATKNACPDWIEQEDAPLDDTTKIICTATPIEREIFQPSTGNVLIQPDSSIPMVGFEVEMLTDELMNIVINEHLNANDPEIVTAGTLLRSETRTPINVLLNLDPLIKTHFGLFGFTGVGKSNLLAP